MALVGTFSTMNVPHLLLWLQDAGKTGILTLEHNKVSKRITFREGRVVACSSGEPWEFLGHFLVSRGKINEETLSKALSLQEKSREQLGAMLVGMGAISPKDLKSHLASQAEEIILSLFEWDEAVFRYKDEEVSDEDISFPVKLLVENVLLQGRQRKEEVRGIRTVFNDPGIVLRHGSKRPPSEISQNRMARRIYESIDGERTVAEILLHAHASEYLVTKFLYELHRNRLVEIEKVRQVPADAGRAPAPSASHLPDLDLPGEAPSRTSASSASAAVVTAPRAPIISEASLDEDLAVAGNLMSRGEYDAALEILNAAYSTHPGDEPLGKLLAEAEASFVEAAYRDFMPRSRIPRLLRPLEKLEAEHISPEEFFLLSRIDGTWDIKSIIQISPIREVDALRTLMRMREKGFIELRDPK